MRIKVYEHRINISSSFVSSLVPNFVNYFISPIFPDIDGQDTKRNFITTPIDVRFARKTFVATNTAVKRTPGQNWWSILKSLNCCSNCLVDIQSIMHGFSYITYEI